MKNKKLWILSAIAAVVLIVVVVVVVLALNSDYTKSSDKAAMAYLKLLEDGKTDEVIDLFPDEVVEQYLLQNQRDRQAWRNAVDVQLQSRKVTYKKLGYSAFGHKVASVTQMASNSLKKLQTKYQDTYGVTVTDGHIVAVSFTFQTDRSEVNTTLNVLMVQIDGCWYVDFLNLPEYPEQGMFEPILKWGYNIKEAYVTAVKMCDAEALLNCYFGEAVEKWLTKNNMTHDALRAQIQTQLDNYKAQLNSENKEWQSISDEEIAAIPLEEWYALRQSYQTELNIKMEDAYKTNLTVKATKRPSVELENVYLVKINGQWHLDILNPPTQPLGNIFAIQ